MLIDKINHITFATRNLESAIRFYQDILGFETIATWSRGAYLISGEVWLCLSYDENTKKVPHEEYTHIAFNIHRNDFVKLETLIKENNIQIWKKNTSEGESLYILDPDFNKLEIHASTLLDRLKYIRNHPYEKLTLNEDAVNNLNNNIPKANKDRVYETYDQIYEWMDEHRTKDLS